MRGEIARYICIFIYIVYTFLELRSWLYEIFMEKVSEITWKLSYFVSIIQ